MWLKKLNGNEKNFERKMEMERILKRERERERERESRPVRFYYFLTEIIYSGS